MNLDPRFFHAPAPERAALELADLPTHPIPLAADDAGARPGPQALRPAGCEAPSPPLPPPEVPAEPPATTADPPTRLPAARLTAPAAAALPVVMPPPEAPALVIAPTVVGATPAPPDVDADPPLGPWIVPAALVAPPTP
ncbi:MAG TPA: hypothetical protein PKZ28_13070, partial [Piscinibacter sp.]|nr:hypothetical protein [Piscinibacter sp.]